jgi:hypothetical protein
MLDEVARWDDLVTGLRPMTYGAKGEPVRCLVSVGPTIAAKASSEGWCLRLRPNIVLPLVFLLSLPKLPVGATIELVVMFGSLLVVVEDCPIASSPDT